MTQEARPASPLRLLRSPWVRALLSVTVLAALLAWIPLDEFGAAITRIPPLVWIASLAAFLAGHAVAAWKWRLLIGLGTVQLPYRTALRFHFAGLFANLFLPSVAGGDVVRAGLALRSSETKEAVVLGSVVDRLIDTAALGTLLLLGAYLSTRGLSADDARVLVWLLAILVLLGILGLAVLFLPVPLPARLSGLVGRMRHATAALLSRPLVALSAFVLSLGIQASFVLLNAWLGRACGIDVALSAWFFAWPMAKLAAMAPISLAGIGVREAALAAYLGRFGVPSALAVAQGLVWETIVFAGGAFGAFFYAVVRRRAERAE